MNHSALSSYMEHGFCFSWEPGLVWMHVGSDILTGMSYYAITIAMLYFAYKRRDLPYIWVFLLFALFIAACGTTHFFSAYTIYVPQYWEEGYVKIFTTIVSVIAAIVFIPKIPEALAMPSLAKTLDEVQRLNREQARSKEELQCIVNVFQYNAASTQDLLDFSLNEAIRMTGSIYGYIYYYDEETEIFTLNSWSRGVMPACAVTEPQTSYLLNNTGLWGEAVRQRKPVVYNDFAKPDPLKKGYPTGHVTLTRFLTIPVMDSDQIVAVIGVANKADKYESTDITQLTLLMGAVWKVAARKRSEDNLQDAKERFQIAVESANDVVFEWKMDQEIQWFGKVDRTGYDKEEFPQTIDQWIDMVHPEDRPAVMDAFRKHLDQQEPYSIEYRVCRNNNKYRWWSARGATTRDSHGKPIRMLGTITDITKAKQAESALLETNYYLENLINYASAPIIVWNPQFRITRFNKAFEALTGLTFKGVLGEPIEILFPNELVESSMESIRKTQTGERWETVELPIKHMDGSTRTVLWNSATIFAADRKTPIATIAQGLDITERIHYVEELRQKNIELEQFVYTVSHDLKSPLVTISTFLTYLQQDIADINTVRIEQDMGFMRSAADKMEILLSELLELYRVGRIASNPVEISLSEIQEETLQLVAGRISLINAVITTSDKQQTLYGDRTRLVDIWQNLVENAVKYMGKTAQPRIELGVEQSDSETVFFVKDNGMGIDVKFHENIFGLFNKLDSASEGSGMGLALVKRIVETYGGRIWVESEGFGKGACFRFTLPEALFENSKKL